VGVRIKAVKPGPGQESVWDYPRPPRLERSAKTVEVRAGDTLVARSTRAWRVLETSHPPVFYVPVQDVTPGVLTPTDRTSYCEFKGVAVYWTVAGTLVDAAWSYPEPSRGFEPMADAVAFYPARLACTVDGEAVRPQAGGFYGGWITDDVVGPFKGEPGTWGW
jgi:uncharacterized protein (DUF427 family)